MAGMPLPTPLLRPEDLANAGLGTPLATLTTEAWARSRGDVDALAGAMAFSREDRPKAEALYDALPVRLRSELPDPEHMWAAFLLSEPNPFGGAALRVLEKAQPGPGELALRVGILPIGGSGTKRMVSALFLGDSQGRWRQVVLEGDLLLWSRQPAAFAAEIAAFMGGRSGSASTP
jgi:hypothetical protein